jgi:epoxyqueuosine reductase
MENNKRKIGAGEVGRFDQRNTTFNRSIDKERSTPDLLEIGKKHYGVRHFRDKAGYTMKDWALSMGAWYVEREFARGNLTGNYGLFEWAQDPDRIALRDRMIPGQKWKASDPENMSRDIKKAAKFLGASLVGICKLDRRWIYSYRFHARTLEHAPIVIPAEFKYAIVMAHEMDYKLMSTSPAYPAFAATGLAYSMMAFVSTSLSHYIRALGYKAIPIGNDTALSIPLAIDAGLGELGRHGLLIAEKFGPRVRISKVLTDLSLVPDKPIEFGVWKFCEICNRCAKGCPAKCISFGAPTMEGQTVLNNNGIYKWYINPEKCLKFWAKNTGACANCIRICPFNKPRGRLHDMGRFLVKNATWLDPYMLLLDKVLGYGKRVKPNGFWRRN